MEYHINIALDGMHWAKVVLGGCTREDAARYKLEELRQRFLEKDGFKLTLTRWDTVGHVID